MIKHIMHQVGSVLDSTTCNDEQAQIVRLIEQQHPVVLDLSKCTYVSSAGLRVMLYAYKIAKAKGLSIYLVGVSSEIQDVMRMTGFDRFFKFYQNIDEIP